MVVHTLFGKALYDIKGVNFKPIEIFKMSKEPHRSPLVTPVLGRQWQKDCKFKDNMDYVVRFSSSTHTLKV
jgi:hypothetical protein